MQHPVGVQGTDDLRKNSRDINRGPIARPKSQQCRRENGVGQPQESDAIKPREERGSACVGADNQRDPQDSVPTRLLRPERSLTPPGSLPAFDCSGITLPLLDLAGYRRESDGELGLSADGCYSWAANPIAEAIYA